MSGNPMRRAATRHLSVSDRRGSTLQRRLCLHWALLTRSTNLYVLVLNEVHCMLSNNQLVILIDIVYV